MRGFFYSFILGASPPRRCALRVPPRYALYLELRCSHPVPRDIHYV